MKTINSRLIIVFFFLSVFTYGQTKDELLKEIGIFYESSYNMDFDFILDKTYPKIFEIANKETLYKTLESYHQNDDFGIRMVYPKVTFDVSEIKEVNNKKIALVTYNSAIRMTFNEKMTLDESQGMLSGLKESMKDKKIMFESSINSFFIEGKETIIAVSDELTENKWSFITYDKRQRPIIVKILGEDIIKELKL